MLVRLVRTRAIYDLFAVNMSSWRQPADLNDGIVAKNLERLQKCGFEISIVDNDEQAFYVKSSDYTKIFKNVLRMGNYRWNAKQKAFRIERVYLQRIADEMEKEVAVITDTTIDRVAVRNLLHDLCDELHIQVEVTDDNLLLLRPPVATDDNYMDFFITFVKYCVRDDDEDCYYTIAPRDVHILQSLREDVRRRDAIVEMQRNWDRRMLESLSVSSTSSTAPANADTTPAPAITTTNVRAGKGKRPMADLPIKPDPCGYWATDGVPSKRRNTCSSTSVQLPITYFSAERH